MSITVYSRLRRRVTVLALALGTACSGASPMPTPTPAARPSLLVFITVDQFRPDYLERYGAQLNGGLARLLRSGAFFADAHQDYAITETAPGHASTMSGRFPRSTGITRNVLGVNDSTSPLLDSSDPGASPFRFQGSTLTDWLVKANPATKALSVSAKDRGAILPIGQSKQQVYWFSTHNGRFTTSTWYASRLPDWVRDFNARAHASQYAGKSWDLLRPEAEYPENDDVIFEVDGDATVFPHRFPADTFRTDTLFRFTPLVDELTAKLALEGVRQLRLGEGPATDVLAISFSATDYVGHFYGPDSREQHDQILRLDRLVGGLLDTLYALRDSTRIVVALTADHGGGKIAEMAGRLRVDMAPLVTALRTRIRSAGGNPRAIDFESGAFFIDSTRLGPRLTAEQVATWFLEARRIPGVMRVDRFRDLAGRDTSRDEISRRWLHMFAPKGAPAVVVTLAEGNVYKFASSPYPYPIMATHGSPHRDDSHVPIIFMGSPFRPGRYGRFVRTADIAPTLARVLGVTPTEPLDGRPLQEAIRR